MRCLARGLVAGACLSAVLLGAAAAAQDPTDAERAAEVRLRQEAMDREQTYYRLVTLPLPDDVVMEVGGLLWRSDGRLMAATRRGDVYLVDGATDAPPRPRYRRWAEGLAEPLGLLEHDGWIYITQRGELTRARDLDGDDRADRFETVTDDWAISGNYHEYAFGPRLGGDGWMWITLNKPFDAEPYGPADWRGWAVRVDPSSGVMEPVATGLRSPSGVETAPWGDIFYTDNQGEWCPTSKLSLLGVGDFHGHPHGLPSTHLPGSRVEPMDWDQESLQGMTVNEAAERIPNFAMPAVWFPYVKLGQAPTGMKWDTTGGGFGPFAGQLFVGDQHHAMIMRVFLEQIDGHWQGAAFRFRHGFQSGIVRLAFAGDDSLLVGMSSRGWGSMGPDPYGLQRLVWTGEMPFEAREMRARPDGFEVTFTRPVDSASAGDPSSYRMESYTYRLTASYGSPGEDVRELTIRSANVADDGMSVRLLIDGLRAGYVHELQMNGVHDTNGEPLLHPRGYYTLVEIPRAGS